MSDLTQPWVWYALGLSLIAALMYAADVYMRHDHERNCDRLLIGADLDADVPPCRCPDCLADDFVTDLEAWLAARAKYEETT